MDIFDVIIKPSIGSWNLWDKAVKAEQTRIKKAMQVALQKTTYDMYVITRQAVKKGNLNLAPKIKYRNDHGDPRYRRSKKANLAPLSTLWKGVTYKVNKQTLIGKFGFLALSAGTEWQARIAKKSISGYNIFYTPGQIERLHSMGIHLKKTTLQARVTARDPIGTIKRKYNNLAYKKFDDYFSRKMAGERV